MSAERKHRQSQLFTVRLWIEPHRGSGTEIRGRAQHVLTGEVIYFRTWAVLFAFFETTLVVARPPALDGADDGAHEDG